MSTSLLRGFVYKRKSSVLHRLDPRTKAIILISAVALIFTSVKVSFLLILLFVSMFLAYVGRVLREWLHSLRSVLLFSIFIFVMNYLTVYDDKLLYSLLMALRFILLTSFFSIFFLTTNPDDFAQALLKIGVPYEYTLTFTMAIRFVPTLARDIQLIIDSQRSRGLELEKGNIITKVKNYIPILIPLMILEIRRSIMIAEALEARAFGAVKKRTFYRELHLSKIDIIIMICTLVTVTLILLLKPQWF